MTKNIRSTGEANFKAKHGDREVVLCVTDLTAFVHATGDDWVTVSTTLGSQYHCLKRELTDIAVI